jgi:hypothetical protein
LLRYSLNPYHDLRDEDRQALIAILNKHAAEMHEFVAAIKARPVVGVRLDKPARLSFGNGKSRL